ncbi:MAG: DNA-3-methyladenine glycosylase [Patescibacteria group bacterium]
MRKVLGPAFFDRPTLAVAKDLIGKYLVRKIGKKETRLLITETEGYHGFNDLASKARRGKTPGNAPMYARPGTLYVYFTYGMHWMLNIVTEREEYPAAVLIRGLAKNTTSQHTGVCEDVVALDGPAKLTKFLKIDKKLNGRMLGRAAGLWVEDRGVTINPRHIKRTPRIGIPNAGEYVHKPWRFVLKKE